MKLLQKISSLFIGFTILSATNPSIAQANRAAVIQACGNNLSYGQQATCLQSKITEPSAIRACGNLSYGQQAACLSSSHNKQTDNRELSQNRVRKKWMYFSLYSNGNISSTGFLEMFDNSGFFYVIFNNNGTTASVTQQMTLKKTQGEGIVLEGKIIASDSNFYVRDRLYLNNLLEQNMSGENCDGVHDCRDFELIYLGNDT